MSSSSEMNFSSLSEHLTPQEIKNKEFKRSLMGYSPKEVVEFLDRTARTWEMVQKQERTLLEHIESLKAEIAGWEARRGELDEIRQEAETKATQIIDEANLKAEEYLEQIQRRAEEIRGNTEAWLEEILTEVNETASRKKAFLSELKETLDHHYKILEDSHEDIEIGARINEILGRPSPDRLSQNLVDPQ